MHMSLKQFSRRQRIVIFAGKFSEPPEDNGFENWNLWADELEKITMTKAEIASVKVGQTA